MPYEAYFQPLNFQITKTPQGYSKLNPFFCLTLSVFFIYDAPTFCNKVCNVAQAIPMGFFLLSPKVGL